MSLAAKQ